MPLSEADFQQEIRRVAGATLASFNQTRAWGTRVYMRRGVCRAAAIVWLALRKEIGAGRNISEKDRLDDISWFAEQQHISDAPGRRHGTFDPIHMTEMYLRGRGLRPDGSIVFRRVDWQKIFFFINARPGYYLVGADPIGAGEGHEIAFCTVGGARMFDPNYGIVVFPNPGSMTNFHTWYWGRAYPDLTAGTASVFRFV